MTTSKSGVIDLAALGRAIRAQRTASLRTVAPGIGVSPATIARVERGLVPDLDTYALICRWLSVSLDTFVMAHPPASVAERLEWLESRVTLLEKALEASPDAPTGTAPQQESE